MLQEQALSLASEQVVLAPDYYSATALTQPKLHSATASALVRV